MFRFAFFVNMIIHDPFEPCCPLDLQEGFISPPPQYYNVSNLGEKPPSLGFSFRFSLPLYPPQFLPSF